MTPYFLCSLFVSAAVPRWRGCRGVAQFRRQRLVLRYIADFLCKDLKLVIEVDGITHQDDETGVKDKRKTSDLESAGFKVIRFTDEDVLKNMSGVIERIERVVEDMGTSSPPPQPPPAGDS